MIQPKISRYLGFYLSKPFWVKEAIDLQSGFPQDFSNLMEEQMFIYEDATLDLRLCRDGRFLLKLKQLSDDDPDKTFPGPVKTISVYVKNINTLALIFESVFLATTNFGYFETSELTNKDCFGVRYENGEWKGESIQQLEKFQNARMGLIRFPSHPAMDTIFVSRPVIPLEIIQEATSIYKDIAGNDWLIALVSSLNKSISEYKIANYDTALVLSWFIIESIIADKWSQWILSKAEETSGRINSARKERLIKGRDYPISVKLNMMEMNEVISLHIYKKLDQVRGNRNAIVHRDKDYWCPQEDAQSAIEAANTLIENHFALKLHLNLSFSWNSI